MAGYGTDDRFTAWLTANGLSVPTGGSALSKAVLRERGSTYLDGLYGARFSGLPTDGYEQERAWPRVGATAYSAAIPDDVVPVAVENASYLAAWYEGGNNGGLSVAATTAGAVRRKKVASIEKEFFEGSGDAVADATVRLSAVEGLLAPYLLGAAPAVSLGILAIGGRC